MANEEKIMEMLENIQADMRTMKSDIAALKREKKEDEKKQTFEDEREAWMQLSRLLTKEEGDSLAEAVEEIERRKAVMYA